MEPILLYLIISFAINIFMFTIAYFFQTDSLTDISYATTFIILIIINLIQHFTLPNVILSVLIITWAVRLGSFLFLRIRVVKKDSRFDTMRKSFIQFLGFWSLQAITVWIILIPSFYFFNFNTLYSIIGVLIWFTGLTIESFADQQKFLFKQEKRNKNKFISTGLWKYSRHPNYFGEILCWIGIYIFVFPSLFYLERLIALVSPLYIIILLRFVSGVPLLEKKADSRWGKNKTYIEYKKKTPLLIPYLFRK